MKLFGAACALLAMMSSAGAAQITLGNSDPADGQFKFTNIGGGDIGVSVVNGAIIGPNEAFYNGDTGSYTGDVPTPFNSGPEVLGIFPVNGFQQFDINFASGAHLEGLVNWTSLKDDSLTPEFLGLIHVTVCNPGADAPLCNDFSVGSNDFIDLTIAPISVTLTNLVEYEFGNLSSGEIVPRAIETDEPPTLAILGASLLMAGLAIRYHRKVERQTPRPQHFNWPQSA